MDPVYSLHSFIPRWYPIDTFRKIGSDSGMEYELDMVTKDKKEQPKHGGVNCDFLFTVTPPLKTICCHHKYPYFLLAGNTFFLQNHHLLRGRAVSFPGFMYHIMYIHLYTNLLGKYCIVLPSWPRRNLVLWISSLDSRNICII